MWILNFDSFMEFGFGRFLEFEVIRFYMELKVFCLIVVFLVERKFYVFVGVMGSVVVLKLFFLVLKFLDIFGICVIWVWDCSKFLFFCLVMNIVMWEYFIIV